MLTIYNNLTRKKELFEPIDGNKVGMYVCGVTTYDFCHIGHGRTFVSFDVISRYLRFRGYDLNFIRNITDIDDKIINRANENEEPFDALTERFIKEMHKDFTSLGMLPPDQEPRATDHIHGIISIIETLIEKGAAYVAGQAGDVYYRVSQFEDYCCLSKQDVEQLKSGARVDVDDRKEDPLDFALWKSVKPNEPFWPSPWGDGRPGWHIECSAMSMSALGETFDIHGGGSDLQFPHHDNEIAQSEAATGKQYAKTWIHTGMVQVDKEKMSKSLDNFFTIREVLKQYDAESVRMFLVSAHYRSQLNYSTDNINTAGNALERFYTALRGLDLPLSSRESSRESSIESCTEAGIEYEARFIAAMDDDFNTPEAIAVLFELAKEINQVKADDPNLAAELGARLKRLGMPLGLLQQDPDQWLQTAKGDDGALSSEDIEGLIKQRTEARANKDWARGDEIRNQLTEAGILLEDTAAGTSWRRG
ncbi:MAG: cysteine--tRNA ligase [Gammaproteobacteria bacterium]|nr:MAG: cysteine--tRNA ligase [Gammaproteobacteria bacterium]